MKQGSVDPDRFKSESRHCFHRRKMLKSTHLLNGDAENMDRTLARELNYAVAAAFHDHLSCTKSSQEFCTIETLSKEVRINNNLPNETDHIYANCSDIKTNVANNPSTHNELTSSELQSNFDRKHRERRMCLLRKRYPKPSTETNKNTTGIQNLELNLNYSPCIPPSGSHHTSVRTPVLATRYFGRRSKTVPSRALKRRYLGPPKVLPIKKELFASMPSPLLSPASERQETISISQEISEINNTSPVLPAVHKKRGRKPRKLLMKRDHLTTDYAYFLPDNQTSLHSSSSSSSTSQIDVPLWKLKPVSSFYQMEGTENINDPVFQRRHMKCELDERRRKRWDMQRLREQKASQKLKYKNSREASNEGETAIYQKYHSFYPDVRHMEQIEVTEALPVLSFGHAIPLFQPCEFSLPWISDQSENSESNNNNNKSKKGRPPSQAYKVT